MVYIEMCVLSDKGASVNPICLWFCMKSCLARSMSIAWPIAICLLVVYLPLTCWWIIKFWKECIGPVLSKCLLPRATTWPMALYKVERLCVCVCLISICFCCGCLRTALSLSTHSRWYTYFSLPLHCHYCELLAPAVSVMARVDLLSILPVLIFVCVRVYVCVCVCSVLSLIQCKIVMISLNNFWSLHGGLL